MCFENRVAPDHINEIEVLHLKKCKALCSRMAIPRNIASQDLQCMGAHPKAFGTSGNDELRAASAV